ncbi:hypothetical protein SNE40_021621 [Patella caerulea]|uniref:Caspase recruitment domain-containing protein n=1 Tax=Patella caerulea TaxID=87958 RepID=A0AAN8J0N2_PATCE
MDMERGRMPDKDYRILQENYVYLIQNCQARYLIPHLHQLNLISTDNMVVLENEEESKGHEAGMKKLIEILNWSGYNALSGFITSLQRAGYTQALQNLQATGIDNNNDDHYQLLNKVMNDVKQLKENDLRKDKQIKKLQYEVELLKIKGKKLFSTI